MQELEKIIEKMKEIKDGNRKEKIYAKYPPNGRDQEILNAYSQRYEDGTDNFYNAIVDDIRKHMNDGWIPVEERDHLPEAGEHVLVSIGTGFNPEKAFLSEDGHWTMLHAPEGYNDITDMVDAWRPLPEPYHPGKER